MKIRYYGHVGVPSGYGVAASEMCMAILAAGAELEIATDGKELAPQYLPLASCIRGRADFSEPDAVIIHTLPLDCEKVLRSERIRYFWPEATVVAYTTWEGASAIPTELEAALRPFDAIWTPSHVASRLVIAGGASTASVRGPLVATVPHPYDDTRASWPRPDHHGGPYRFLYVGAWTARKNVEGVIRAYLRAFTAPDPRRRDLVELVIQSHGAGVSACQVAQIATGVPLDAMPTIRFSHQRLSDDEIWRLHHECDCFVTATRGEAWNIPAFDAMLAGSHIIAPDGQGSDEFLHDTSAWRYASRLAPASGEVRITEIVDGGMKAQYLGSQGLSVRSDWQEPDISELALLMRRAFLENVRSLRLHYDPAERFGRASVGRLILTLLENRGAP